MDKYPYYTQYEIPADTYDGIPAAMTVAVKATIVASNDLSEDAVYNITKTLFEAKDEIIVAHAKGKEIDTKYAVEGIDVAFHPGAEKYFKEIGAK
jgi:TRAP transporter TAXI family solute receptor